MRTAVQALVNAALDQPRPSAALTLALEPFVSVEPEASSKGVPTDAPPGSPRYRLLAIERPERQVCHHKAYKGIYCREPATFWGQWQTMNRNRRLMYYTRALCRYHADVFAKKHGLSFPRG